jgi:hypothetical protein
MLQQFSPILMTVAMLVLALDATRADGYADVIVVVDGSSSMANEAQMVQAELNALVSVVAASGVDLRLILVDDGAICAPPPVGSGSCPADENLPAYRHHVTSIGGGDAFTTILSTHASWSSSLRPDVPRTLIVVTNDDDDISWSSFDAQLLALDPSFAGYRQHAIVAHDPIPMGDPCEAVASGPGTEYIALAA